MIITYSRPENIDHRTDPDAPAADLDPAGILCGASTYDVDGTEWTCTRRPGHTDDEHRAAFDVNGDGPTGAVAFAWQYEHGGAGYGPASPEPLHTITVTVTFPASASTGVDTDRIAASVLDNFWECDHEHIQTAATAATTTDTLDAWHELTDLARRGREDFQHQADYGDYTDDDRAAADARWTSVEALIIQVAPHLTVPR